MKLRIFQGFVSIVLVFFALFGGSHPPAKGNPIEDLIANMIKHMLSCVDDSPERLTKTLVGTWHMSLVSVVPPLPGDIPFNPFRQSSNWKISESGGNPKISFDGKDRWYNEPPLIHFDLTPVSGHWSNAVKTDSSYYGSGTAKLKMFVKPDLPPSILTDITVSYNSSMRVTMQTDNVVTASIVIQAFGEYTEDGKIKDILTSQTITYTGTRK